MGTELLSASSASVAGSRQSYCTSLIQRSPNVRKCASENPILGADRTMIVKSRGNPGPLQSFSVAHHIVILLSRLTKEVSDSWKDCQHVKFREWEHLIRECWRDRRSGGRGRIHGCVQSQHALYLWIKRTAAAEWTVGKSGLSGWWDKGDEKDRAPGGRAMVTQDPNQQMIPRRSLIVCTRVGFGKKTD